MGRYIYPGYPKMTRESSIILSDCDTVGSGAYGRVIVGNHNDTMLATKRRYITKGGSVPMGCIHLNEIDMLTRLSHPHLLHARYMQRNSPVPDNFRSSKVDTLGRDLGITYRADLVYILTDAATEDMSKVCFTDDGLICDDSRDRIREYLWQIMDGINYLHSQGIIHRDIKPANILYFNDDPLCSIEDIDVRVCDYDMCMPHIPGYYTGKAMTPEYAPPEILTNGNDVTYDYKVDTWGLGHVLYFLVKGDSIVHRGNREGNELDKYVVDIVRETLDEGIDLGDKDANDLLTHMLCIDPNDRYTVRQCMEHPFFRGRKVPTYTHHDDYSMDKPYLSEEMLKVFDSQLDKVMDTQWYGFFLGLDILLRVVTKKYRGNPTNLAICCYNLGMKYFDKEDAITIPLDKDTIDRVEYSIIADKLQGHIYRDTVYTHIQEHERDIYKYLTCPDIYPCRLKSLVSKISTHLGT